MVSRSTWHLLTELQPKTNSDATSDEQEVKLSDSVVNVSVNIKADYFLHKAETNFNLLLRSKMLYCLLFTGSHWEMQMSVYRLVVVQNSQLRVKGDFIAIAVAKYIVGGA